MCEFSACILCASSFAAIVRSFALGESLVGSFLSRPLTSLFLLRRPLALSLALSCSTSCGQCMCVRLSVCPCVCPCVSVCVCACLCVCVPMQSTGALLYSPYCVVFAGHKTAPLHTHKTGAIGFARPSVRPSVCLFVRCVSANFCVRARLPPPGVSHWKQRSLSHARTHTQSDSGGSGGGDGGGGGGDGGGGVCARESS
jgi:uncharacterized membrane protein YgcG